MKVEFYDIFKADYIGAPNTEIRSGSWVSAPVIPASRNRMG